MPKKIPTTYAEYLEVYNTLAAEMRRAAGSSDSDNTFKIPAGFPLYSASDIHRAIKEQRLNPNQPSITIYGPVTGGITGGIANPDKATTPYRGVLGGTFASTDSVDPAPIKINQNPPPKLDLGVFTHKPGGRIGDCGLDRSRGCTTKKNYPSFWPKMFVPGALVMVAKNKQRFWVRLTEDIDTHRLCLAEVKDKTGIPGFEKGSVIKVAFFNAIRLVPKTTFETE